MESKPQNEIATIKNIFLKRVTKPEGIRHASAVLAPLIYINGELHLIFTKRALTLSHQPGDVCFPGGGAEECDATLLDTALRETFEELGIDKKNITILGEPDFIVTAFGVYLKPYLGLVENITLSDLKINQNEVDKVFTVPIKFFMENKPIVTEIKLKSVFPDNFPYELIYNGRNYKWQDARHTQIFFKYQDNVIWGITARIANNICSLIKEAGFNL